MTENEFLEKYGKVKVKLRSYYKYTFTFTGVTNDGLLQVDVGGDRDDIYRCEIEANKVYSVVELPLVQSAYLDNECIY